MHLALVQTYRLEVRIEGGATGDETVFPAVAEWLAEDSDHWNAFKAIKDRKVTARYRSLMDFILCEVCPTERPACVRFYRGKGPRLIHLRTEKQLRYLESRIMLFLTIAYEAFCQQRALSWTAAREMVNEICAAA